MDRTSHEQPQCPEVIPPALRIPMTCTAWFVVVVVLLLFFVIFFVSQLYHFADSAVLVVCRLGKWRSPH